MSEKRNYRLFLFVLLIVDILGIGIFGIGKLRERIPDTVFIRSGQEEELSEILDYPAVTYPDTIDVSDCGTYKIPCFFLGMIPLKEVQVQTVEERWVSACGEPVGLYMETQGVLIVDTGEIVGKDGVISRPAENIARAGDYILEVNGIPVAGKRELIKKIEENGGNTMELLVRRKEEEIPISLHPVMAQDESYKLGIWVRDNTQGIGTVTYVEEDGTFGALGHGISDVDTGELLRVSDGELYEAEIVSIMKGTRGTPGELSGYIEYQDENKIGMINENTEIGIFGRISDPANLSLNRLEVGYKQEVKEGKAQILVNLDEEVKAYDIEITKIYKNRADTNKAFTILVTDPELLAKTGGIVQGMSGSPVLQEGKLIGAVTHVFVQDSAKGYGVFIENMLQ